MITTKQRDNLRKQAHSLKPLMQIGKSGITETVLQQAEAHLFNEELIKVKVLQNADFSAKEIINDFASRLNAEPVSAIGSIMTLYKRTEKEGFIHIQF